MKKIKELIFFIIIFAISLYMFYITEYITSAIIFITSLITLILPYKKDKDQHDSELLEKIDSLLKKVADGKLTDRITLDKNETKFEKLAWHLNNALDQVEVVLRESRYTISAICKGDYERRLFSSGLHGEFKDSQESIQKAIEALKVNEKYHIMGVLSAEFSKINNGLKGSLHYITNDILKLDNVVRLSSAKTSEAFETSTETLKAVEDANRSIENLSSLVQNTTIAIENLNSNTKEISSIVTLINDIADQTNLLALNAAIEAARAGQHGRGFAVVADEIRLLAEKTQKATEEITLTIQSLQQQSLNIQTYAENINNTAEKSNNTMKIFASTMSDFNTNLLSVTKASNKGSFSIFMEAFKIEHIMYKSRAYSAIINEHISDELLNKDYKNCDFGKWYYTKGEELFGDIDIYKKMGEEHKKFHEAIEKNLSLIEYGETISKLENRESIIKKFKEAEEHCEKMFLFMDQLSERVGENIQATNIYKYNISFPNSHET